VRRLVDAGINSPNPRASDAARRSVSKLMNLRHKYDVEQLKLWWAQHRHEFETTAADPKAGDERH